MRATGREVLVARITCTGCGRQMPPDNNTNYFPTHLGEVAAIRSWISAGALDN